MTIDVAAMLEPLSADAPCGEDLDGTQEMAVFDAMRVFGQGRPLGETVPPTEDNGGRSSGPEYRWRDVLDEAEKALAKTKDLRILVHASAATLRLGGLGDFTDTLEVAAEWLARYWAEVYPRVEEDGFLRANTLGSLADKMAVLDALRRTPLASHRQLGACTIRDLDAAGKPDDNGSGDGSQETNFAAIFAATSLEDLQGTHGVLTRALAALARIEAAMNEGTQGEAVPSFAPLTEMLRRMVAVLAKEIAVRQPAEAEGGEGGEASSAGEGGGISVAAVGSIRSRADAMKALDAVAEFFRRNEPASPVPLFVERAKRMITMNFLELLEEVAPGGVAEVKSAAGIRDQ